MQIHRRFSDLNALLVAARSHPELVWTKSKSIALKTIRAADTLEEILAPAALMAAELFSTADPSGESAAAVSIPVSTGFWIRPGRPGDAGAACRLAAIA